MKKKIYNPASFIFCVIIFVLFFTQVQDLFSQTKYFAIAEGKYFYPIGSLANRFKNATGGSVGFGGYVSQSWSWSGNFEYYSFKEDPSKFKLTQKVTINNVDKFFTVPLPKLKTDLKIAGVYAIANYNVFDFNFLKHNLEFGFGVYYWTSNRSEYFDTLKADDNGKEVIVSIVRVPHRWQEDWSAGFNLGTNIEVKTIDNVWITLAGNYKVIVGELWPALEIGLENIATFQTIELKAGIKVEF